MSQASRSFSDALTIQLKQRLDIGLFLVVMVLLGLGLVMVTSASIDIADKNYSNPLHYFYRQSAYILGGLVLSALAYRVPLRFWERHGLALMVLALLILLAVLIPGLGKTVNGATRWLRVGPVSIQASEIAKLLIILYLAGYLVRHSHAVRTSFAGFIKPVAITFLSFLLLLAEPDFGAAVVVFLVMLGMLFIAGARLSYFALCAGVGVVGFAYLAMTSSYRVKRLMSFTDPWADPFDTGFQLTQSLIAIGSGSWTGLGLGASVQKLSYLPEAHNDFLFAILGEELGLVGVTIVIALYTYALWRAFAIGATAERTGHLFGGYLAFGIGLWIGIQAFVNMGVNMGVLPTKGLTLPFMSAGGSSLWAMCIAFGLLLRVHREVHDLTLQGVTPRNSGGEE